MSLKGVKSVQASRIRAALRSFGSRRGLGRMEVANVAMVAMVAKIVVCQLRSADVREAAVV